MHVAFGDKKTPRALFLGEFNCLAIFVVDARIEQTELVPFFRTAHEFTQLLVETIDPKEHDDAEFYPAVNELNPDEGCGRATWVDDDEGGEQLEVEPLPNARFNWDDDVVISRKRKTCLESQESLTQTQS